MDLINSIVKQSVEDKLILSDSGRKEMCTVILQFLFQAEWTLFGKKNFVQLRYLNRILPIPSKYVIDQSLSKIPLLKNLNDCSDICSYIISESQYTFLMDLPHKRVQDTKYQLTIKKSLDIKEALAMKLMGIDILKFPDKFSFDIRKDIFKMQFSEVLDFLVVCFPSSFIDTSLLTKYVPRDLGFVKNEAYTGYDVCQIWFSCFKVIDFDLSSNCISNLYIKAKYWSLYDKFFPDCDSMDLSGNVICNPPYPFSLEKLIANVSKNINKIENMLLILPPLSSTNSNILHLFQQEHRSKYYLLDIKGNFYKNVKLNRYASCMRFILFYIGKNVETFKRAFAKFKPSKRFKNDSTNNGNIVSSTSMIQDSNSD
jgi:hypothetical protein